MPIGRPAAAVASSATADTGAENRCFENGDGGAAAHSLQQGPPDPIAVGNACSLEIGHSKQAVFCDFLSQANCLRLVAVPVRMQEALTGGGGGEDADVSSDLVLEHGGGDGEDSDNDADDNDDHGAFEGRGEWDDGGGAGAAGGGGGRLNDYEGLYNSSDDDDDGDGADRSSLSGEHTACHADDLARIVRAAIADAVERAEKFTVAPTRNLTRDDLFEVANCAGEHFFMRVCADGRTRGVPLVDIQRILNAPVAVSPGRTVKMRIAYAARFGNRYRSGGGGDDTLRCVYPDRLYTSLHGHMPDASLAAASIAAVFEYALARRKNRRA